MKVTMDRAGRIVIPKPVRDRLGLVPDHEFDLVIDGTGIRLDPVGAPRRAVLDVEGWPVLAAVPEVVITDDDVRAVRDAGQR